MLQYVCAAFRWRAFCEDREYFMFKTVIRGKSVITDDDARDARVYLENRLTRDEFDTIFGWARENKKRFSKMTIGGTARWRTTTTRTRSARFPK